MKTILSRRHFLNLVGAAGGSTAVYQTSMALGLIQESGQWQSRICRTFLVGKKGLPFLVPAYRV
jgi:hypothetical protein